ncbi:MAG: hypothetical protein CMH52_11270 [Myxococcales bacterium]|nr:hypothetical protein [Myxococcales bacterium]
MVYGVSLILFIIGFNILILVHELGHFLAARFFGMKATRFSIGFGPALIRIHGKETIYQFALIPFGGYVQLEGLTRTDHRPRDGHISDRSTHALREYPPWQRAIVMLAGPMANFLLAIVTYSFLFGSSTAVTYDWRHEGTQVIRDVSGAALAAGLKPYDSIESINGFPVRSFSELKKVVGKTAGQTLRVTIRRSPDGTPPPMQTKVDAETGLTLSFPRIPNEWPSHVIEMKAEKTPKGYVLGISPDVVRFGAQSWSDAIRLGCIETWAVVRGMMRIVGRWFEGTEAVQLASVVKMADTGADTLKMGLEWFISFMAILSINLGVINLFPLPALDGGRLLFVGIEAVSRKAVPPLVESVIHGIGMLLLMILMVVIVVKEIMEKF